MSRKLRPLAALALSAMVALISACGSNAPAATGSGIGGGSTAANVEKAVKFAECMRDNGVSEFPDPNASGDFAYGIKAGSPLDPGTAAWQQAIGACKDLEPPGFMPKTWTTEEIDARLKFARCIRENGMPDFPDPTDNGPLINVPNRSEQYGVPGRAAEMPPLAGSSSGRASEAKDVGAGRSGRPGCRHRHQRRGRHVQREASDPGRTGAAGEHREGRNGEALGHGLPGWDPDLSGRNRTARRTP